MSNELKNIISGTLSVTGGSAIQTALNYLRASKKTGREIEKIQKERMTKILLRMKYNLTLTK
jgi:hypothetical protein